MIIIYKAINILNNKCYIGQTYKTLHKRKTQHYQASSNINHKNYNYKFPQAIRKYGIDNFRWEILNENLSQKSADMWERLWIFVENSYNNGYNMTEGGHGLGRGKDNPMYGKIPWNKGLKNIYSEETKSKMSKAKKNASFLIGDNNPSKRKDVISKLSKLKENAKRDEFGRFIK